MRFSLKTKFVRCIDGDTIIALIDQGLAVYTQQVLRLARINAPELKDDPEKGSAAKKALDDLCKLYGDERMVVETLKRDPYGRWVAEVWIGNGETNLSDWLVAQGHAVPHKY